MKALTVRQPWAWAIASGKKRFENRNWKPSPKDVGTWIAIHSSAKGPETLGEIQHVEMLMGESAAGQLHLGVIVCVARLAAVVKVLEGRDGALVLTDVTPAPKPMPELQALTADHLKWIEGPIAFFFDRVRPTPLVKARGALNLWELPQALEAELGDWGEVVP